MKETFFANALWHLSESTSAMREETLPVPKEDELVIQSYYSLISLGTEWLVATGRVPETLNQVMQVPYMQGTFPFPVKYGYSLVGKIVAPDSHRDQWVHVMHPHQDQCVVKAEDVRFIPSGVHPRRAVLFPTVETIVNAIWDGRVAIGDRVLILGFGLLGSMLWRVLSRIPGVQVAVIEENPWRRQWAREHDVKLWSDGLDVTYDVAFNTTRHGQAMQKGLDLLGFEGRLVELSWYGIEPVTLHLGQTFHSQRKQIVSSQVAHLPADHLARWDFERRSSLVWDLLQDPTLDDYLTHEVPFAGLADLFNSLRSDRKEFLTFMVRYR
ncbi:MAG: zinc-binding alcohol dehydrogenase [Lewinellaceae bacterium]|nr:zinc-binding alcohol dehydrogenase [Lewinellaceae bacterium]